MRRPLSDGIDFGPGEIIESASCPDDADLSLPDVRASELGEDALLVRYPGGLFLDVGVYGGGRILGVRVYRERFDDAVFLDEARDLAELRRVMARAIEVASRVPLE